MIALLKGIIEEVGDGWAVVDVNGVGYLIFCSTRTLGRLAVGEAASIHVETHVREDHIHLYGFLETNEREWFKVLTTVQGVGAKVGLAILSGMTVADFHRCVQLEDAAMLVKIPGVGKKTAERLIIEMRDKIDQSPKLVAIAGGQRAGQVELDARGEATDALVSLGYKPAEAARLIAAVDGDDIDGSAELIRRALKSTLRS